MPGREPAGSRVLRPPSGSRGNSRTAGADRAGCRCRGCQTGAGGAAGQQELTPVAGATVCRLPGNVRPGNRGCDRQTGAGFGATGLRFRPILQRRYFGYTTIRWLQRSSLLHFPRRWYRQPFPAACTGSGQSPHSAVSAPNPSGACWR